MPSPSNAAGSVEVQAPPGLEAVNGFCGPSPLITSGSPAPGSIGPIAPPKPEGLKEELVREVTGAVREHIEVKMAAAVDTLWQKGQRAMQHLQQQHLNQTSQLQSQLLHCAEAHQQLQRENAMLRSGLEALMKHLTMVFGPPPGVPGVGAPPGPPPGIVPPTASTAGAPPTPEAIAASVLPSDAPPRTEGLSPTAEAFDTPAASPAPVAHDLGTAPAPPPAATASVPATPPAQASQAPSFSLTLRRADNVPLGLDIAGEADVEWLVVEGIRLGGAVEAWNRQCHGDAREIRKGDRIVMINGAKDADSMREECLNKHLLRMTVVRGAVAEPPARAPTNAAVSAAAAINSDNSLRAEAVEFVPQARVLHRAGTC